jgi:hypothetical protein
LSKFKEIILILLSKRIPPVKYILFRCKKRLCVSWLPKVGKKLVKIGSFGFRELFRNILQRLFGLMPLALQEPKDE